MRIQLRKKLLDGKFTDRKHECLVTVVSRTEITIAEYFRHGNLCDFFSVTENSKLGFPHEDFLTSDKTCLTAFNGEAIISKNLLHFRLREFHLASLVTLTSGAVYGNRSKIENTAYLSKVLTIRPAQVSFFAYVCASEPQFYFE